MYYTLSSFTIIYKSIIFCNKKYCYITFIKVCIMKVNQLRTIFSFFLYLDFYFYSFAF